jgi:PTH1 family peptidyl-tRNA hydrolase
VPWAKPCGSTTWALQDIVVLYDELDLAPGKVRIKTGGGSGGHNGIKSIDAHCGKDYRRVRLGIGHPGSKDRVTGYVLGDFAKADAEWLEPLIEAVGLTCADLLAKRRRCRVHEQGGAGDGLDGSG